MIRNNIPRKMISFKAWASSRSQELSGLANSTGSGNWLELCDFPYHLVVSCWPFFHILLANICSVWWYSADPRMTVIPSGKLIGSGVSFCLLYVPTVCDKSVRGKKMGWLVWPRFFLSLICIHCWRRSRRRDRAEKQLPLELQQDIIVLYKTDRREESYLTWGIMLAKPPESINCRKL